MNFECRGNGIVEAGANTWMERSNALFWKLSRQDQLNVDRGDGSRKITPTRESVEAV